MKHGDVYTQLSHSRATLRAEMDMGLGRHAAIWSNNKDRMSYDAPKGHTISLYLKGGTESRRLDRAGTRGFPGALCLIPQGAYSDWEINGAFDFLHLYLPDAELRHALHTMFDREPSDAALADVCFASDPALSEPLTILAQTTQEGAAIAAETALSEALNILLSDPRYGTRRQGGTRGGLSPRILRRVTDYMQAHMDQPLRLRDMANIAGLSEFHFQRMFRHSTGISPHNWVERARTAQARHMMAGGVPLAQIAAGCGYSSQSHFTRAFRKTTGQTPARYLRAIA